jgi:hypothetical protein
LSFDQRRSDQTQPVSGHVDENHGDEVVEHPTKESSREHPLQLSLLTMARITAMRKRCRADA